MKNNLRKCLRDFKEYQVTEIHEKHVINANESPYNIMEDEVLKEKVVEIVLNLKPNLYPDPLARDLKKEIKNYLETDQEVIVGNGADEVISYITRTFLEPGDVVITHTPTFEIYRLDARIMDGVIINVEDLQGYIVDTKEIIRQAQENKAKMIFLCVPNNPTGYLMPREEIIEIIEKTEALIILDEAYIEFAEENHLDLLETGRVIILRTLSKAFGMAGLRLGYGVSTKEIISCVEKVREPYNLNSFTQKMGVLVLQNRDRILEKNKAIIENRKKLKASLEGLPGVEVFESRSNFLLTRTKKASRVAEKLKEKSILAKVYSGRPKLEDCIRLTITTEELNDMILDSFKEGVAND